MFVQYLIPIRSDIYCSSIADIGSNGAGNILGGTVLQNLLAVFDIKNSRFGFKSINCETF